MSWAGMRMLACSSLKPESCGLEPSGRRSPAWIVGAHHRDRCWPGR